MKTSVVIDFAPYKAKQLVTEFKNTGKIDLGDHIKSNEIHFDRYLDYLDRSTDHIYQNYFISMIVEQSKQNNFSKDAIFEGKELIRNLDFFRYDFQSSLIPESIFEKNQILYLFGELERISHKSLDSLTDLDYDYINLLYEHKDALTSIFKSTIQEFGDYIIKWQYDSRVSHITMMMNESRSYLLNCASIMNKILEIYQEIA
jgi:hypothetical protein